MIRSALRDARADAEYHRTRYGPPIFRTRVWVEIFSRSDQLPSLLFGSAFAKSVMLLSVLFGISKSIV